MRYIKNIAAFIALMMTVSCIEGLDEPVVSEKPAKSSSVQVYARITNFSDQTVDTRSAKVPEEARVSSMALAIFPIEGGVIQPCIDYYYEVGQKVNFTIDRKEATYDGYDDKPFAMYVFANIPNDATIGKGKELDAFKSVVHSVSATYYADADFTGLPDAGFPMMGSLGDASADGKTLILKPTVSNDNPHSLPLVNGSPADLLNIPMESMYAKFSFSITINPTQIIDSKTQSFTLESYTLHNIPSTVDFKADTNNDEVLSNTITIQDNSVTTEGSSGEGNSGKGAIEFSFYVPERYLTPATSADTYEYPFGQGAEIRDEDLNLRQRYKPELLGDGQKATYVTIKGKYLDHNARTWSVSYDIYLGADNYGDFNIIRNTDYINSVEIRGVTNSADMVEDENAISIDHRVNIERSLPIIESLRRETLLDSHFEVRPLRIRAVEGQAGKRVNVSIQPNDGTSNIPDWIRLEHKNDATAKNGYNDYLGNGKRKYFTYGLVTGEAYNGTTEANNLSASTSVTFESRTTNDCIWIYVDECTETYGLNADGSVNVEPRSAKIVVTIEGESVQSEYVINQSKLYPVYNADSATPDYLIESYEEYLYNYDAEDTYTANKTHFEGMAWGLDGVQLSNKHVAADPSKAGLNNYNSLTESGKEMIQNRVGSYYDFYNVKHDSEINTPDAKHSRAGQHFCDEIIQTANIDDNIGNLMLDDQPESAVEYCYNRNKRNRDGSVPSTDWYLPAIDEIEDIMVSAYSAFDGVFQSQDYWSCQPSFHRCFFFISWQNRTYTDNKQVAGNFDFYIDDKIRARSTKATFTGYVDEVAQFAYNPSGITIPASYNENRTGANNRAVNFTIKGGYYKWMYNRGGNYASGPDDEKTDYSTNPPSDSYDHKTWYVTTTNIWPEFGEDPYRQDGSRPRTEMNRVRCVFKKK